MSSHVKSAELEGTKCRTLLASHRKQGTVKTARMSPTSKAAKTLTARKANPTTSTNSVRIQSAEIALTANARDGRIPAPQYSPKSKSARAAAQLHSTEHIRRGHIAYYQSSRTNGNPA